MSGRRSVPTMTTSSTAGFAQRSNQMAEFPEAYPVVGKAGHGGIGLAFQRHDMHAAPLRDRCLGDGGRHGATASDDAQSWLTQFEGHGGGP